MLSKRTEMIHKCRHRNKIRSEKLRWLVKHQMWSWCFWKILKFVVNWFSVIVKLMDRSFISIANFKSRRILCDVHSIRSMVIFTWILFTETGGFCVPSMCLQLKLETTMLWIWFLHSFYISNYSQAPAFRVVCIFKVLRADICLTAALWFDQINEVYYGGFSAFIIDMLYK